VAYQLLGSGFIGSAFWTLAAVGAFLFAVAILAALYVERTNRLTQCIIAREISRDASPT